MLHPARDFLGRPPALAYNLARFFEVGGSPRHNPPLASAGNPVRTGDGCATVTGYKLPMPLAEGREGGSEV